MKKGLLGAIISGLIFILYLGLILCIIIIGEIFTKDIPIPIVLFIMVMLIIPLIGITIALISRIKEINKGELDEAKKY